MKGVGNVTKQSEASCRRVERGAIFVSLLILLLSIPAISVSKAKLRYEKAAQTLARSAPPIYLPDARYVKLITFGFNAFAGDILWFTTINYFGKHYEGDKDYRWFYQMCDLVTELDRNKKFTYEFCGTLLSWEAKNATLGNAIFSKAVNHYPNAWRFHYLRGFNYWYFLEDKQHAEEDLKTAAQFKEAPAFVGSIAARLIGNEKSMQTAIIFLSDLIRNTADPHAKQSLLEKLKRAYLSERMQYLQEKVNQYETAQHTTVNNLDQLVQSGFISAIPEEPFEGRFFLDPETHKVATSSGKKGLEMGSFSAKTGFARDEFKD